MAGLDRGEDVTIPALSDIADWEAYEAARRKLIPNLSRSTPAARYAVATAHGVDGAEVTGRQVRVGISTECADTYKVTVRRDTKGGETADQVTGLSIPIYFTAKLARGHTYWLHVAACNGYGCAKSKWQTFKVK